jgi:hypothetical protein
LLAPNIPDLKKNEANKQNEKLNQINPNDLFHAHNFEININLSEPGHASNYQFFFSILISLVRCAIVNLNLETQPKSKDFSETQLFLLT